jgi:transposase
LVIPLVRNCVEGNGIRGTDERSGSLFSYVDLEARVPKGHLLRAIREIVNGALVELSADFAALYAPLGRPSIPPEKLLRASLLQEFYTIRSERRLMERLQFDLLLHWFVVRRPPTSWWNCARST